MLRIVANALQVIYCVKFNLNSLLIISLSLYNSRFKNLQSLLHYNKLIQSANLKKMDQNNPELQRISMEGNAEMVSNMMRVCREKTLKKSHNSD